MTRLQLLCLLALGVTRTAPAQSQATLELVETAPVETRLDQVDIAATHDVWRTVIERAEHELALAHFYASDAAGSRLTPLVAALEAAAARGVQVRFLADAKFAATYPDTLERLAARQGVEVRRLDLAPVTGGVLHAKYLVADHREVCVGSANFDWRALQHIQELGALLDAPEVARQFLAVFDLDWRRAGGATDAGGAAAPATETAATAVRFCGEPVLVTPVFSPEQLLPPGAQWDLPLLVRALDQASDRIRVQLLSYSTRGDGGARFATLDDALRRAAARGVDVRLLLAHWSKRPGRIAALQDLQRVAGITVKLMTIPEASAGFIPFARVVHAKYLTIDGAHAWVGTSNWSEDYFRASRNAGLMLEGRAVAARLERFFLGNWHSEYAETVDPDERYRAPAVDAPGEGSRPGQLGVDERWPAPERTYEVVRVVDGDTVHVERDGARVKLRLLSVDTEEKRSGRSQPAGTTKPETDYGQETAEWAQRLFAALATDGAPRIGLRFPGGEERFDRYGRLLCHVVLPDGTDYNLQLVREGRSPYFNKYGNSELCHDAFVSAQEEARAQRRGIWGLAADANTTLRPYARLLPWWQSRADAVAAFRDLVRRAPDLYCWADDPRALGRAAARGVPVTVLGLIETVRDGEAVFRPAGNDPRLHAPLRFAGAAALAGRLLLSQQDFRQNYVQATGLLERGARGFLLRTARVDDWHVPPADV